MARRTNYGGVILIDADKKEFKRMMNALMDCCYKPNLTNDALRVWWQKLEKYEFETVAKAFDTYTNTSQKPPLFDDIIKLCQHKVTIFARLLSPLAQAENKQHSAEVLKFVADGLNKTKDMKGWARDLISGKKISNQPDLAIKMAKEALKAEL